ncbi:ABC transporter ATP-binding protein [Ruania albidiflava]|uniref:ABC transporter ATP-binding protein n=1 Tax=Ruania albidiflava TaxID=366586 RepID=UPI0003B6AE6A|nr:ABC transporter ATP-binding protein [Ruania albidiflava]
MITSAAPEPATSVPVIDGQAIAKLYPGPPPVTALHPTCVRIHAGEKLAILGASGSGKSTLLAILGTLDDPSAGTVLVQGQDLGALADAQRSAIRAATIGFVFQQFHLLPTVSAAENVATGLLYTGVPRRERQERAVRALEAVGLGHRLRNRPGELSGGEQQRVAIARSLVREPAVLFADEPTGALDSTTGESIITLLTEIATAGTAVVMVTHDVELAGRFPRRLHLSDGRIIDRYPAEPGPGGRPPSTRAEGAP